MINKLLKISFYIALAQLIFILGFISYKYKIKIIFEPFNYVLQYTQDVFQINFEKFGDRTMRRIDKLSDKQLDKNTNFNIYNKPKNDFEYLLDKNNRKRIFNLINTGNNYHDLKLKTPALAKGTWDKLGYLDGVLSDYSATNFIDQENKLWIGTWTGVTVYDGQETFSLNHENGLPKYPIWDIFQDKNNNIWASSGDGSIDKGGLVLIKDNKIEKVFTRADGLGGNSIGKLNQNLNGDLLIGGNGGFQIYDGESFKVYNYTNGLANGYVRSYFVEGNSIWIGTLDGLVYYNGKKFKVYNVDDGLANNNIFTIKKGPNGKLWIGTEGGLSVYDGTSFNNLYRKDGLRANNIQDIYFDENGNALIATWYGLNLYNGKTFILLHPETLGYEFGLNRPMHINKSQDGMYWISDFSGSGIVKYDPKSIINITKSDSFPTNTTIEMKLDKNNNLWVSKLGSGLVQIVNESIKKHITINDGLRSNNILDIEIDNYGNIWLATQDGLSKYDGRKISNYTTNEGLPTNYIHALYIDNNGIKWLMTKKGLIKYNGVTVETFDENDGLFVNRDSETISGSTFKEMYIEGGPDNKLAIGIHNVGLSIFDGKKFNSDFSSPSSFQRKAPGRNNHNAPKLIEKYNDLAREALSNGDKILSENYFQHADHFMRILAEQENNKSSKVSDNKIQNEISVLENNNKDQNIKS